MENETVDIAVIFRMFEGEVLALFPYDIYNHIGLVNSYMHVGQHSGEDYSSCIERSKPATEKESKDLKKELESIGYNLTIVKRRNFNKYINAFNESRGF